MDCGRRLKHLSHSKNPTQPLKNLHHKKDIVCIVEVNCDNFHRATGKVDVTIKNVGLKSERKTNCVNE